ncbi:MAG: nickel-dependent hydrogenase large subunit [Candidatus Aerophobus sp.]|nr:MAG: nickel-dependent hydrogenase large subunit [Candidatus Aerophobus sp.]
MSQKTVIPVGPYHPLQEEPEFFELEVEGEKVTDINVNIGYNHRGIEKIAESKTFDQMVFLVERICGICSTSHPIANCNAVEDLAGIEIPERAKYIRSIVGELERLHSHLLWVGLAGHFIGYNTLWMWAWKYREPVLDLFEAVTGNRNHYAMMRPGGVRQDIEEGAIPVLLKGLGEAERKIEMVTKAVLDDPVLAARLKGVGILPKEEAINYCALGPTARASGVDIDVRKDEPYAAYGLVDWKIITQEDGDVFAKAVVRLLECFESIKIIRQCLKKLKSANGDIAVQIKEYPPGEGIGHHEAPRGETFHYIRSDGSNMPVRLKVRAPSYSNLPTCKVTVPGESVADATLILASIDPCYCCTERMARVVDRKRRREWGWEELLRLSRKKTERIKKGMGISHE